MKTWAGLLLMVLAMQTAAVAQISDKAATGPAAFDCEHVIATKGGGVEILRDRASSDLARSPEDRADARSALDALTAECYYTHRDFANAARLYRSLPDRWVNRSNLFLHDDDGMADANASGMTDAQHILWHGALALEASGDIATAKTYVAEAFSLDHRMYQGYRDKRIAADFKRLDPKQYALAVAKNDAAQQAEDDRFVAEREAYAKQFSGARRTVAQTKGRPCRRATSDSAIGHVEIWYYGCYASGGVGNEWYTFRNGALVDHETLTKPES